MEGGSVGWIGAPRQPDPIEFHVWRSSWSRPVGKNAPCRGAYARDVPAEIGNDLFIAPGEKYWFVEFQSIEGLMAFVREAEDTAEEGVILTSLQVDYWRDSLPCIEIYDGYRE